MDLLNVTRFNQDYEMSSGKPEPSIKTTMANESDEQKTGQENGDSYTKKERTGQTGIMQPQTEITTKVTGQENGESYTKKERTGQTGMMLPQKENTEITTKVTSGTDVNFNKEFPILILVLTSFF